jgi:hypothetical protein
VSPDTTTLTTPPETCTHGEEVYRFKGHPIVACWACEEAWVVQRFAQAVESAYTQQDQHMAAYTDRHAK